MNILIMDGQGGRLGSLLVEAIRQRFPQVYLSAVGTNAMAAAAMKKAGAHQAASGENPTLVACRKADVIIGPIGIVIADAMCGEMTPRMANAVAQSNAKRLLIPVNHCDNIVVGVADLNLGRLIQSVVAELRGLQA